MKTNILKQNTRFFALMCLFAVPLFSSPICKAYDEDHLTKLVRDFLDVRNCKKSFVDFASEFQSALKDNPDFVQFCKQLDKFKRTNAEERSAKAIGMAFFKYKDLMPDNIKMMIKKHSAIGLLKIMKKRVKA